jgi:hypothetical protein
MCHLDRLSVADARASMTALTTLAMTFLLFVGVLIVAVVLFDVIWSGLDILERVLRFLPGVRPP